MLAEIEKPTTVLALLAGATASVVTTLSTLAVLVENWMEPGCDLGNPDRNSAICDINGEDYTRALPYAAVALAAVLLTALLCRRVLRRQQAVRGTSKSVRIQIGVVLTIAVLAVLGLVAALAAPMYV